MSSYSKVLTSSDGSAAAGSASAAYHADVRRTAGKYALAVGTVLLPIEVPLLISVYVSFVILILVNDTSDKTKASILYIWSPLTELQHVEFIVSADIVPLCVILVESHACVE
ncbi:hypothetical protein CY34DRAFT_806998 [Suillus luteus UH-Slu-Lm8-n1]|uniref:Uncharacterized protein n=1 Tax=Suillus luteus UH-Slu-Lm8-n1 TaxID=930992 RepID=A0A0C9ZS69_9AGAM|nr:hypothetical protein CY34DRAFT_806998 [Suillus luteus UH-Slu-Lm8-n1]